VLGFFTGSSLTAGSVTLTNQALSGGDNAFLVKYNAAGVVQWGRVLGGMTTEPIWWAGLAVDDGKVYVAGTLQGPGTYVTFGSTTLNVGSGFDVFATRIEPTNGTHLWASRYGSTSETRWAGLDIDLEGNLYLTGSFRSPTLQFGSLSPLSNASSGSEDVFVAKINLQGTPVWAVRGGGTGADGIDDYGAIDVTKDGVVIATTIGSPSAVFGGTTVSNPGVRSVVVGKLTTAGQWQGAFIAASGSVWATGVVMADTGAVYVSGSQEGTASYLGTSRTSSGLGDAFVARVSPTSSLDWVTLFGNAGQTYVVEIGSALGGGVIANFDNGGSSTVTIGSTTQQMNDLDSMVVHIPPSGELP
jgi:hypothetical protein